MRLRAATYGTETLRQALARLAGNSLVLGDSLVSGRLRKFMYSDDLLFVSQKRFVKAAARRRYPNVDFIGAETALFPLSVGHENRSLYSNTLRFGRSGRRVPARAMRSSSPARQEASWLYRPAGAWSHGYRIPNAECRRTSPRTVRPRVRAPDRRCPCRLLGRSRIPGPADHRRGASSN